MSAALKQTPVITTWGIESSHLVDVPESYEAGSLKELRRHIQLTADRDRPDRPPIGDIEFRYETDDEDEVQVVHCFFTNRHGHRTRFMRLRRRGS